MSLKKIFLESSSRDWDMFNTQPAGTDLHDVTAGRRDRNRNQAVGLECRNPVPKTNKRLLPSRPVPSRQLKVVPASSASPFTLKSDWAAGNNEF